MTSKAQIELSPPPDPQHSRGAAEERTASSLVTPPAIAILAGVALGLVTAYAQGWLPDEVGSLANSSGSWVVIAFLLALLARGPVVAALSATAALSALVGGYVLGAGMQGNPSSSSLMIFWGLAAVVAVLCAVGVWRLRRPGPILLSLGTAAVIAVAFVVVYSADLMGLLQIRQGRLPVMPMSLYDLLAQLRTHRWVDLTHTFAPGIPHYVGFPDESRRVLFHYDEGVGSVGHGFLTHEYRHIGQWGTHMDPPAHFARGGRFLDEIPVTDMILPLVVLDVRSAVEADHDYAAGPDVLEAYEAEQGRIPADSFVALNTGWGERWPDGAAMQNQDADGVAHYPGWSVPLLRTLVEERGVAAVGHDTTDTDRGVAVSAGDLSAETYVLGADRWQLEMLANLDQVPPVGALIVATWPKPLKGSGFPARAFAILP